MIILPSRVKNEDEKKKTGLILPSRVKDTKTAEQTTPNKTESGTILPQKKTVVLPSKKQVSEVEQFNKEQSGFWKTIARVLLPKKLESKYGVEKIEPVKTTLSGGWENLTPEQQDTAKEIFKKETPTALKAKVPAFFQSLKETSTKDIPYYGSGKEAVELVGVARAYNRVKDGKGTEKDKILLNDYYEEQERQAELQKNVGYRAGETIKGSVRFMGELLPVAIIEALTGTVAPAGETYGASKLAQKGTKEVLEGMIKDKVTRNLVKDVAKKKLATLTKQFILTAPTNITAGTAERMIGVIDTETGEVYQEGQPISEAVVNATTGHAVELITELGGGVSGKVLGGLTAPVKKIATKTAIFNALRKKLIGASDAKIEALLRKTGWNGVIGEFFEERDADILNDALYSLGLGDQNFEGLTKDDIATELIAFSVMGGGTTAIKSVARLKEGLQKKQDIKKMQETKVKMPPKKATVSPEIAPTSVQTQETVKDTTKTTETAETVKMPPKKSVVEDPLIQEAKKYKSAEEFVKAQGTPVYHGTPYEFDKFDISKINTGEMSQSFGKGLYLSDSPSVANYYKNTITKSPEVKIMSLDGKPISKEAQSLLSFGWNKNLNEIGRLPREQQKTELAKAITKVKSSAQPSEYSRKIIQELESIDLESLSLKVFDGKTMEVSANTEALKTFLDFSKKPTEKQISSLKKRLGENYLDWDKIKNGDELFSKLNRKLKNPEKILEESGIYGIRYDVGTLSGGREAGNNYVFFRDSDLKTKSQLTDIWNKAQEKPIEKVEAPKKKAKPIKYESTIKKSGLAKSVRKKAIREKLIYGFDKRFRDLPEYDKRIKTEDRDKAIDFVLNDTDNAYEVAMGRQKPKGDILPEDVYVATVDYYTELGDIEKVLDLTMNSQLVGEATLMGQRIQALSQLDPLNPAKVLNDIKKEKEKALSQDKKKRGKKSKAEETKDMKDKIERDTKKGVSQSRKKVKTWVELVESLKC